MVRSLLENTYDEVVWIDPTITRLPRMSDFSRSKQVSEVVAAEPLLPRLTVLKPGGLPIEPLAGINLLNDFWIWKKIKSQIRALGVDAHWDIGVGRPSRLALWACRNLPVRARFMDVMDDFPAFYSGLSRSSMELTERELTQQCDYFFCSEHSLIDKLTRHGLNRPIKLIPNGYDMERLPSPCETKRASNTIGFVGTIAGWFDWKIVIEMAKALPQVQIQLIGPRVGHVPALLPKNIELLPTCTVADAIRYSQKFTVGLIPFLHNQLTESVDPIKYYELRALGIPVWTTAFGSMKNRLNEQGVSQIYSGANWQTLWNNLLTFQPDIGHIQSFRENHDWRTRFCDLKEWLHLA